MSRGPFPSGARARMGVGCARMASLDKCRAYLSSVFAMTPAERASENRRLRRTAVTFSRLCGARAKGIAGALAEHLSDRQGVLQCPWTVFDDNLVRQVLEDHDLPNRLAKFMPEDVPHLIDDALSEIFGARPSDWALFQHTVDTIYRLASLGRVIVVGRGANIITRSMPSVLHVRLVGSAERRAAHLSRTLEIEGDAAWARMQRTDRARRRYVVAHFDRDIDSVLEYDLVLNTDQLSNEEAVRAIASLVLRD